MAASLSLIGIPVFGGFVTKMLFATAADSTIHAAMVLIVLALSTLLNAIYFIRTVVL
ncbi:MAG: hypothetical protein V8R80_01725 [Eubacterium sp.]